MGTLALFLVMSASSCLLLLLFLPWILQSSREAERMFALVKSSRQDTRKIPVTERITGVLAGQTHKARTRMGIGQSQKMGKRFLEAGLRGPYVADMFFLVQVLGLVCGGVAGSFIPVNTIFWTLAVGVVGYMAPDVWLATKQKERRSRIRPSIPDMVDLLVVCVGAGLGLDQALIRVSEELSLSHPELTEELERVTLERRAGASRLDAWRALAERTGIEELSSFVNMLSETDRFGTPIIKALSDFSEEVRTKRRQQAEEAAAKTKIKIIFPLVICIFPCIFIVLVVPAVLSFIRGFSGLGK